LRVAGAKRLRDLEDFRPMVFGDEVNYIGMFRMADEAYAVAGAVPDLARYATAVIGSNDEDAVARWLAHRWQTRADPLEPTPG
jgi:hydroxymethylpyrimidine pyrophosphatase-like HAD family hydrolase